MGRIKFVLAVALSTALALSVILGGGAIAQPLGGDLLQRFGVGSNGTNGGTEAALPFFGVPVTVLNPDTNPMPVTVQGSSADPLTATINGTVDTNATVQGTVSTNQENVPGSRPFQTTIDLDFGGTDQVASTNYTVPGDKILIIRYVSGEQSVSFGETMNSMKIATTVGSLLSSNLVVPSQVDAIGSSAVRYDYTSEVWIEADPGSVVIVVSQRNGTSNLSGPSGHIVLSGYLLDAPAAP